MRSQKGQIILILILVMTVALAIGLSIVQKSLVDVSTASKVEQSSRAFSAAEAGVEKALNSSTDASCTDCQNFSDNSSNIKQIFDNPSIPTVPAVGSRQLALEYPPLAKEDVAQVWLADPTADLPTCGDPKICYTRSTLDIYWGNSATDKAAIELTLVYSGTDTTDPIDPLTTKYRSRKWFLDQSTRTPANGFEVVVNCTTGGNTPQMGITTYQCKKNLTFTSQQQTGLMLIRARLLYNSTSQPFAVQSAETCAAAPCNSYLLPSQSRSITSVGVAGETQRKVRVFQLNKVVPPYFDYAIFSAGAINK